MSSEASSADSVFFAFVQANADATDSCFERFVADRPADERQLRELWADFRIGRRALSGAGEREEPSPERVDPLHVLREMSRADSGATYAGPEALTEGGMSLIEVVDDKKLGRRLVRKVLPVPVNRPLARLDRRRILRFLSEVRITSRLQHPSILTLVEVGIDEQDRPFFTMPRVHGEDLARILERHHAGETEWSLARVLQILVDVCGALEYAHRQGVVHRDLKPQNIMVGGFGETLVMDWGLAKFLPGAAARERDPETSVSAIAQLEACFSEALFEHALPDATMDGDVVGTPAFMSPEQAQGRLATVSPATDQFALGAILYLLLSGQRPYGDSESHTTPRDLVQRVRNVAPTPLEQLAPDAPAELIAIAKKAMARNPDDRYVGVGALAADLRAFLEQRAVSAHDASPWFQLRLWTRRNPGLTRAAMLLLLLVVSSLLGFNVVQASYQSELEGINEDLVAAEARAERRLTETQRNLYYHMVSSVGHQLQLGEDFGQLRGMLEECPEAQRDWEWHYLDQRQRSYSRELPCLAEVSGSVELSAAGDLVAAQYRDGVRVHDLRDGRELCFVPEARSPLFGPRGRQILVRLPQGRLGIFGVHDQAQRRVFEPPGGLAHAIWTRGGQRLAVCVLVQGEPRLLLLDSRNGAQLAERVLESIPDVIASSLMGERIAIADRQNIRFWDTRSLEPGLEIALEQEGRILALGIGPLGLRVTVITSEAREHRFDARTGRLVREQLLPIPRDLTRDNLCLEPSLFRIAYVDRGSVFVFGLKWRHMLEHRVGSHGAVVAPRFLLRQRGILAASALPAPGFEWTAEKRVWWVSDGHVGREVLRTELCPTSGRVAVTGFGRDTLLLDPGAPRRVRRFPGDPKDPTRLLAFFSDGETLLCEGPGHRPCLYDTESGALRRILPVTVAWAGNGGLSPDDRWVWVANDRHRWLRYDLERDEAFESPYRGRAAGVAFGRDSRTSFLCCERGLVCLETESSIERWCLELEGASSVDLSPDGSYVALGLFGGDILLLDAETGTVIHRYAAQARFLNQVRFTPSGRRLFSVSFRGNIKLWDPFDGRLLLRFGHDGRPFQDLDVSADGTHLVATGRSGVVYSWILQPWD